jgi:hypothetical protein
LSLGLALTLGPTARVTGGIAGYYMFRPKFRGQNIGMMSLAQIYFPPMAWQLADGDQSVLFEQEGWVDVSSWLNYDPKIIEPLNLLVPRLPVVRPHRVSNDKTSPRRGRRSGRRHARMASPTPAAAAVLATTTDARARSGCSHDHAQPVRGRSGCVSATPKRTSDRTPAAVVANRKVRCP